MRRFRASSSSRPIQVELDGEEVAALEGEPVAVSLLAAGHTVFSRSIKYHRPRGPFCLEGSCGQCLMRINGAPNVMACQTLARAGMRLERQNAFPSATLDVFSTVNLFFPRGLDPHRLFAGVPLAKEVLAKVARQLAGLGKLPESVAAAPAPLETRRVRVAVIGGGRSGQAVAQVLVERRVPFVMCERADPEGLQVLGLYEDVEGRFAIALNGGQGSTPRLVRVDADHFVIATGGRASILPFEDNDAPGIYSARAMKRLVEYGVRIGERPTIVGRGAALEEARALAAACGAAPAAVLDITNATPVAAHHDSALSGFSYRVGNETTRVDCDAVVVALPPSPNFELARHTHAAVSFDSESGGFIVSTNAEGQTTVPGVWAAGIAAGARTQSESIESGARVGRAVAEALG